MNGKLTAALFLAAAAFASCSTINVGRYADLNEHLKAENSLVKKRLTLIERENSIYKSENIQYKMDLAQQTAKSEKREGELRSLEDKYRKDVALWEGRHRNLLEKNAILEKESSEKLKELTELNRNLEARLSGEIKRLNEETKRREDAWGKERETMKKESAQREFALAKELEELKKSAAEKEKEISSLKVKKGEILVQMDQVKKEREQAEAVIRKLEASMPPKEKGAEKKDDAKK